MQQERISIIASIVNESVMVVHNTQFSWSQPPRFLLVGHMEDLVYQQEWENKMNFFVTFWFLHPYKEQS
jgi:hypothetical protein